MVDLPRHPVVARRHNSDPKFEKNRSVVATANYMDLEEELNFERVFEIASPTVAEQQPTWAQMTWSILKTTHTMVMFGEPHAELNSLGKASVAFATWNFELFLIAVYYNTWGDVPCASVCFLEAGPQDFLPACMACAICMPLSAALLHYLEHSARKDAHYYKSVTYLSKQEREIRSLNTTFRYIFGVFVCMVASTLSLVYVMGYNALNFLVDYQITAPLEKKWLVVLLMCVALNIFAFDVVRSALTALLGVWLRVPSSALSDAYMKIRVFSHWIAYGLIALFGYLVGTAQQSIFSRFNTYSSTANPVVSFCIYMILTNSSNLLMFFLLMFSRPEKWHESPKKWDAFRRLHLQNKHKVAMLITCHLSADVLQQTLEAALKIFTPSQVFICDNGRSTNPLDLWECTNELCSFGHEGSRFISSAEALERHHRKFPTHVARTYPFGKTAWVCDQVSNNWNNGEYEFHKPEKGHRRERINYVWIPEGSKVVALWYVAKHYCQLADKFKYILQIDDDVILPESFILPFDSFLKDERAQAVVLPLHAINMKQANTMDLNMFTGFQELEYRSVGYIKWVTSQFGTALFCHGAASFWRRDAFVEVLTKHDTMHAGDDVQMGLNLHGLQGNLDIPGSDRTGGFKIDTAWHSAIGTQVPTCWAHNSDWKHMLHRLTMGITAGFCDKFLNKCFKRWKTNPCSCGEPSLFFQRAMGWDTTEHRFVGKYCKLLVICVTKWRKNDWLLAIICLTQIYIVITDISRTWMIPILVFQQAQESFITVIFTSYGVSVVMTLLFCWGVLRKRGHHPPPYKAVWLYPAYKWACLFWFRVLAICYNLLWYLPFNRNRDYIYERMFRCDCDKHACSSNRYLPPFHYYSNRGHLPPGPLDDILNWSNNPLSQWHTVDHALENRIQSLCLLTTARSTNVVLTRAGLQNLQKNEKLFLEGKLRKSSVFKLTKNIKPKAVQVAASFTVNPENAKLSNLLRAPSGLKNLQVGEILRTSQQKPSLNAPLRSIAETPVMTPTQVLKKSIRPEMSAADPGPPSLFLQQMAEKRQSAASLAGKKALMDVRQKITLAMNRNRESRPLTGLFVQQI
eukprot:GILJ01024651.1.p1 GENE.GILJ01024651.1~~GILJ01024651.1.p1  ORF type:complete len:1126 (+),score=78.54 GILJ01024651.1:135-3380(+)